MIDLILYAITIGKLQLAAWALYYIYRRQNYKHNSNFIPKTVANLIEPKVWPLCKQGMAGFMDGPPSVDVEEWQAGHLWILPFLECAD